MNELFEIQRSAGLQVNPGERTQFPIVGVGASAGGLEAFTAFLSGARPGDGICYVFVQHLDPNHESLLGQLLSKKTELAVVVVTDGMKTEADKVFLIPPNKRMTIRDGILHLKPFDEPRGVRRPIDEFLQSLAEDQLDNAGCVILSGTGSDGTHGLRAIKTGGGVTLVQEADEAQYSGMPDSALKTGMVDASMRAAKLAPHIHSFFNLGERISLPERAAEPGEFLEEVLETVRARTGHDFSRYKNATLLRRLQRRMQIVGAETEEDYLTELVGPGGEATELFRDLLINVTNFFRDPEQFDTLRRQVIPEIFKQKKTGDRIRVWCPGCSSGEEPYTVAMLIAEQLVKSEIRPQIQIFGTDIDPGMLEIARKGIYPETVASDIPPELFERYFTTERDGFQISPEIRDMVRLSDHSVIKDPPFSRLDLIVCRNLLIYFGSDLQDRVIPMFHYALRKSGFLFIGPSENLGEQADLFEPLEKDSKIFRKRPVSPRYHLILNDNAGIRDDDSQKEEAGQSSEPSPENIQRIIAKRYTSPHVVVNGSGRIVHASAHAGRYIDFAVGSYSATIHDLAREGLRASISSLLIDVPGAKYGRMRARDIPVEFDDDAPTVDISAEELDENHILIVFMEHSARDGQKTLSDRGGDEADTVTASRQAHVLEQELASTRAELRATIEKLETSNEELKSSNEEMMSMNEEMQSANEELSTMNDELQDKNRELAGANADIVNYLEATRLPVVFLNEDLTIRSFTPQATEIFALQNGDTGRKLADIRPRIETEKLFEAFEEMEGTHEPVEISLITEDKKSRYLTRVMPYRTATGDAEGVVVIFTDITDFSRISSELDTARTELQRRLDEIERLYEATPLALGLFDREHRYLRLNQRLADIHDIPVEEHLGRTIREVLPPVADAAGEAIDRVFETGKIITLSEHTMVVPHLGPEERTYRAHYYPVEDTGGIVAVGAAVEEITEQRAMEAELRRVMRELQHRVKNMLANVLTLVRQADRSKTDKVVALKTLAQRLNSLAATHDALTQTDWREADFHSIVESELTEVYGKERIDLKGPKLIIAPRATLSLGMALHEMATNAAKYGALAKETGRLAVRWKIEDEGDGEFFHLEWKEKLPKNSKRDSAELGHGFGSTLITTSIEGTLEGSIEREFEDDGLRCTFSIPLNKMKREPEDDSEKT